MRTLLPAVVLICAGCASYVTPGGAARFDDINRADIAEIAARKASPSFPARIAIARVQAPGYRSHSVDGHGEGRYTVVPTQELLTEAHLEAMGRWPSVAAVAPVSRLLLPTRLDSLEDLRLAAAKLQADVLLVYTLDTSFRIQGRGYGPLAAISLGLAPDRDAHITATASALFTDVRSGFVYGIAETTARASGLTSVWGSHGTIDRKRIEAEGQAFAQLLSEMERTWAGIARQHAN